MSVENRACPFSECNWSGPANYVPHHISNKHHNSDSDQYGTPDNRPGGCTMNASSDRCPQEGT